MKMSASCWESSLKHKINQAGLIIDLQVRLPVLIDENLLEQSGKLVNIERVVPARSHILHILCFLCVGPTHLYQKF